MPSSDSVDKIVLRYFACLTRVPFEFKGKAIEPKPLTVSPLLLRGYTCPAKCGACCPKFTLDYLPDEAQPPDTQRRVIEFNGKQVPLDSVMQADNSGTTCQYLSAVDGRCGVYLVRPFSCDFELIRTLEFAEGPNVLTQKLYGRGWNMKRVDGERGALCTMTEPDQESKREVVRKLLRLIAWSDHFGIETWAPQIIELVERNRLSQAVLLDPRPKRNRLR